MPIELPEAPKQALALTKHLIISKADREALRFEAPQAEAALVQGPSLRIENPLQELGRFRHPLWAGFALRNTGQHSQSLVLFLDQPTIDHADLFIWRDGRWDPLAGRHELAQHAFERDRYPSFDVNIAAGQTVWMMLRQHTVSPMRFTLKVQATMYHHAEEVQSNMILVAILCIPVAVGFMLVTLKRLSNTEGQWLFLGFIAADLIGAAWLTGLVSELFPRADPVRLRAVAQAAFGLVGLLGALHLVRFLKVPARYARWLVGYSLLCLVAIVGTMQFDPWLSAKVMLGSSASMVVMTLTATLIAWRHGRPYAGLYSVAWSVYLVSFLIYALYVAAIVPPHSWGFAVFMQSAGVCLLIGYTIARSMLDRDSRLLAALAQAERQREQIATLSMERDRLFAAANHDLRQPIQAIALNLELIQARSSFGSDIAPILGRMRSALASMGGLLTSLLDLRRADFMGSVPELSPVALQPILQRLAVQYREQARAKGLGLRLVPTRVWVMGNEAWLERALSNLLANALRYTDSGRVVLGVRRGGADRVRVVVIDTGRGIAKADMARVFGEHQRADDQEKSEHFGLGLYIVGRLARAMQASVHVRSEPGRGSEFGLELKRTIAAPQPQVTARSTLPDPSCLRGRRLLLCDDDPVVLATLHDSLSQLGLQVTSVATAEAAIEWLSQGQFESVLSDLYIDGLPRGLEVQTFAQSHQPQAQRLVMTADPEALSHLVIDGNLLHQVLPKPVGLVHLIEALSASNSRPLATPL